MKRPVGRARRGLIAAVVLAACIGAQGAATASAAAPDCAGRGVPDSKISIQLWTFAEYTNFLSDPVRTEEVLRRLSEMGYRNVEPFGDIDAEWFRGLLDKYGLKASARHVDVGTPENPADIEQIIADNKTLGIKYFGSGSTPIFPEVYTTKEEWLAYAAYLDEVGETARKAGQRLMIHNHHIEFLRSFDGQTVFDLLAENTDSRNVVFQLDLYWVTAGGADPLELIEEYGNRIQLFHVKDADDNGDIEIVGEGTIDFPSIFAAAGGSTRYFVVEHDPRFGDPTFDPFEAAEKGFAYLDCVTY